MPSFPAFKTKPYYDPLKTWLTTSLNEDGTLRSDAVQEKVAAAIAAEPTVVQAAADAVDANPTIATHTAAIARVDPGTAGTHRQYPVKGSGTAMEWRTERVFDARAFGIIAGDSGQAAANSTKINDLVTAVNTTGGGTIAFADGDVFHSQTIPVPNGVNFVGNGARRSRLRMTTLNTDGLTIIGASVELKHSLISVRDLAILGPGKTAGGTGVGIRIKWASFGTSFNRVWIMNWASHGVSVEDSYSILWANCQFDENGGDGFHSTTNINNMTFLNTLSQRNTGRGYYIHRGAGNLLANVNAERNGGAGIDLRYVQGTTVQTPHLERNGQDGTSSNIYLHWSTGAGDRCTGVTINGGLIQGGGTTKYGITIDGANNCSIVGRPVLEGHVTSDVNITANAARTELGSLVGGLGPLTITDASATTGRLGYDQTSAIHEVSPGLRFVPRTSAPTVLTKGAVWFDDASGTLKYYDGATTKTVATV